MGLLDGLERLITEHGSAAILRERIQLLNDRHAAVERERDQLRAEVSALKSQLQAAQAQIDQVRRLKEQPDQQDDAQAPKTLDDGHLTEAQLRVLVAIAERPHIETDDLAKVVGVSVARATLDAERLLAANLVAAERFDGAASFDIHPTTGWSPTTAGLQALDDRGLLR